MVIARRFCLRHAGNEPTLRDNGRCEGWYLRDEGEGEVVPADALRCQRPGCGLYTAAGYTHPGALPRGVREYDLVRRVDGSLVPFCGGPFTGGARGFRPTDKEYAERDFP